MKSNVKRRDFLKGSAAIAGATLLPGLVSHGLTPSGGTNMREWYCCMGLIFKNIPPDDGTSRICGVTAKRSEFPVIFNLTNNMAQCELTTYFEDDDPMSIQFSAQPHQAKVMELHRMKEFPEGKLMAFRITSDQPVLPQISYAERVMDIPDSKLFISGAGSRYAHPGPLGKRELKWAYTDGQTRSPADPMADLDWFVILNPDHKITAEISIEMCWADRIIKSSFRVPPQRVKVYTPGTEKDFLFAKTYGTYFTSNTPVAVEAVRRYAQVKPFKSINQWTTPAVAIGDMNI